MLEPEVIITVADFFSNTETNLAENLNENLKIKDEIPDVEDIMKEINISSSEDNNEFDNSSEISKMPENIFISKRAQDICKMIEKNTANESSTSILRTSNSDNTCNKTALNYFLDYFPEQIFTKISEEMDISTDSLEIQELFGIHILMNVLKYPRYDMYWSSLFKVPAIADRMTKERFENLRNNLKIVKVRPTLMSNQPKDSLWRLRPIVNSFTTKCQFLATELNPSLDEQIIPFLLRLNTTKIKKQRKVLRVLFSFVGLAIKNSWLEYKKDCIMLFEKNEREIMDLLEFTLKAAELLLGTGRNLRKRQISLSDESNDENSSFLLNQLGLMPVTNKKPRLSNASHIKNIRYDGMNHWPVMDKKPQRCKLENCPKKASVKCFKCNLHLCMSSNRNCFMAFHVQP